MEKINIELVASQNIFESASEYNIVYGVDSKFISHALISIMSVMKHAHDKNYHFHIVSSDMTKNYLDLYKPLFEKGAHGLTIHHIPENFFSNLPTTEFFTRATYYRLLAPLLLKNQEKVLYIDADIICRNRLDDIWSYETGNDSIALVVEEAKNLQHELARSAGLKGNSYFNAGMMFIDIALWNANGISELALNALNVNGKNYEFLDQDALNNVLEGKVRFIDHRFNTIMMISHDSHGFSLDVPDDTCLIHYAGEDKPWQHWNAQYVSRHYRELYRRSALAEVPFDLPKSSAQAKKMYKLLFRERKVFQGLYWRVKYYQMRYF